MIRRFLSLSISVNRLMTIHFRKSCLRIRNIVFSESGMIIQNQTGEVRLKTANSALIFHTHIFFKNIFPLHFQSRLFPDYFPFTTFHNSTSGISSLLTYNNSYCIQLCIESEFLSFSSTFSIPIIS